MILMSTDSSEIVLHLAGETGQAGLTRTKDSPAMLAAVDQHAAEVRYALAAHAAPAAQPADPAGHPTLAALLEYARGFVEAAVGHGWWPRRHAPGGGGGHWGVFSPEQQSPDWESLRLTAVCQLVIEAQSP